MPTKSSKDWTSMMEDWFMKLPAIPKGGKDAIVAITPWIALIFGILGIVAGLAGFGILTALSPFVALSSGLAGAGGSIIGALLGLIASVLLLMGFPGTKARKMGGWKMIFYSEVVNTVSAVVSLSLTGVIVALIGFYLLYQIKSYYK